MIDPFMYQRFWFCFSFGTSFFLQRSGYTIFLSSAMNEHFGQIAIVLCFMKLYILKCLRTELQKCIAATLGKKKNRAQYHIIT